MLVYMLVYHKPHWAVSHDSALQPSRTLLVTTYTSATLALTRLDALVSSPALRLALAEAMPYTTISVDGNSIQLLYP